VADLLVTVLAEAAGRRLYDELGREAFAFRNVPHARWSAQGLGATVTFYESGKLVVQGRGTQAFAERYLADVAGGRGAVDRVEETLPRLVRPTIGSDESGKGDYFGALTVAGVLARPEDLLRLEALGVEDSKLVADSRVRRMEGAIASLLPNACRVLEPEVYNEAYAEVGNVNKLLGRLHAEVIDEVLGKAPAGVVPCIIVDRFGDPEHVRRHLGATSRKLAFTMPTRAESNPAVAAASLLARAAFLRSFDALRDLADGDLYLGASDPRIVPAAARLLREGGRPWLGKFAKLHFRVTEKASGLSPGR
jgi:ribonuclease HIII